MRQSPIYIAAAMVIIAAMAALQSAAKHYGVLGASIIAIGLAVLIVGHVRAIAGKM